MFRIEFQWAPNGEPCTRLPLSPCTYDSIDAARAALVAFGYEEDEEDDDEEDELLFENTSNPWRYATVRK